MNSTQGNVLLIRRKVKRNFRPRASSLCDLEKQEEISASNMQDTVSSNNDALHSNNATRNENDFKQMDSYQTDYSANQKFPHATRGA